MSLKSLELELDLAPGAIRPQVLRALRVHGEPLRWAVTAVDPVLISGLTLRRIRLEAVLLPSVA